MIAEFIEDFSIDGIFTLNARTCRAAGAFQDIQQGNGPEVRCARRHHRRGPNRSEVFF